MKVIQQQSVPESLRMSDSLRLPPALFSLIVTFLPPIVLIGLTLSSRLCLRLSAFYSLLPYGGGRCRLDWLWYLLRWWLWYQQTTTRF